MPLRSLQMISKTPRLSLGVAQPSPPKKPAGSGFLALALQLQPASIILRLSRCLPGHGPSPVPCLPFFGGTCFFSAFLWADPPKEMPQMPPAQSLCPYNPVHPAEQPDDGSLWDQGQSQVCAIVMDSQLWKLQVGHVHVTSSKTSGACSF